MGVSDPFYPYALAPKAAPSRLVWVLGRPTKQTSLLGHTEYPFWSGRRTVNKYITESERLLWEK
jgi:hypothetical protein